LLKNMGSCGSSDAVEVTATTSNSAKPLSRPPTAGKEPVTQENNNSKNEKIPSRPESPRDKTNERPQSAKTPQTTTTAVSNGNLKNDQDTNESSSARKTSAVSQKGQKESSRAPSAEPLWLSPPTLPVEESKQQDQ
jgi:hypothetical protein